MTATTFVLIDLSMPTRPRHLGHFGSRRAAHREALRLNLRGYQVRLA